MKTRNTVFRKTALAAAVVLLVGGVSTMDGSIMPGGTTYSWISSAYAGDDGGGKGGAGGHKGAMGEGRGGEGAKGAGGPGYRGGKSIVDVLADDGGEDDSDAPAWAGTPGRDNKPGGGNAGSDTEKGGDYGDLFVVLRDVDGEVVTTEGNEHYVLLTNGTVIITEDGEVPAEYAALAEPVEFGRMNLARAPASVLEHSLVEALSKLDGLEIDADNIVLYTDPSGRLTTDELTIDSPLENQALYVALLTAEPNDEGMLELSATSSHDGADTTYTLLVDPAVRLDLAAAAIAASSDKTGVLTADEIVLISSFLDVDDELASFMDTYTYDKDAAFANETVSILVPDPDGEPGDYMTVSGDVLELMATYASDAWTVVQQPEVMEYGNEDAVVLAEDLSGIYLFTQAADDAVQVLEFVHETEAP